ncbi:hypothetical protein [Desulfospira joergensenii]|uniref:hypothetical protein n=1 Tax=Desulfospira joergensenii TaxID=53329 RepID=UPI0003B5C753|nr:hypothetical protein [Desulfospira joergensenii]
MMPDVLIEVQDDLASRIALRYACQLEKSIPFTMRAVHIPDLKEYGRAPGNGWVRNKWEDVVVDNSANKIAKMVRREFLYCYTDSDPLIISGDRDQVIFKELSRGNYGFFIQGMLHSFEPDLFLEKLNSRLYRHLPCPALLVKNLAAPGSGTLIIGTPETMPLGLSWLSSLLNKMPGDLDILVCHFESSADEPLILENDADFLTELGTGISKPAQRAGRVRTVKGSPDGLTGFVRDYALVVSFVPEIRDPMARLLAMSPCPMLFCPDRKSTLS